MGKWLRKSSIDELPQLFNVAEGAICLWWVHGRRFRPRWRSTSTGQRRRLRMRPGLTCLWALRGRDRIDFESWMRLDLEYIDKLVAGAGCADHSADDSAGGFGGGGRISRNGATSPVLTKNCSAHQTERKNLLAPPACSTPCDLKPQHRQGQCRGHYDDAETQEFEEAHIFPLRGRNATSQEDGGQRAVIERFGPRSTPMSMAFGSGTGLWRHAVRCPRSDPPEDCSPRSPIMRQ